MSKTFTVADVAAHKDEKEGMYIIVDDGVYNITGMCSPPSLSLSQTYPHTRNTTQLTRTLEFINEHPGGSKILKRVAGKDATKQFWKYHNEGVLKKYGATLKVGTVGEKAKL
jgi:cytochrome b involved in lipid metabolism